MGGGHLWEAIGAIGEAFSAIGLFFVLVQVRHARKEMQRSITQTRVEGARANTIIAMDERILAASIKANTAFGGRVSTFVTTLMERAGLAESEARLLQNQQYVQWGMYMQIVLTSDAMTAGERIASERNMRISYGTNPVGRAWYESTKALLNPDAVGYVDNVLAQQD